MAKILLLFLSLLVAVPGWAGVVFEIEFTDHTSPSSAPEKAEMTADGSLLKLDVPSGQRSGTMIYRGDRREMIAVDHDGKSYFVMDEAAMKQVGGQMEQAMAQMEQAMAGMPESQRKQIEEMMKGRMPAAQPARAASELRRTGESDTLHGYPCVRYEIWREERKLRELWVTDWKNVEGGDQVVDVFVEMTAFVKRMLESMPRMGDSEALADPAFEHMRELGGYPVVTREFAADGSLVGEAVLRAARRESVDPAAFEPPAGYKQQTMSGR